MDFKTFLAEAVTDDKKIWSFLNKHLPHSGRSLSKGSAGVLRYIFKNNKIQLVDVDNELGQLPYLIFTNKNTSDSEQSLSEIGMTVAELKRWLEQQGVKASTRKEFST